MHRFKARNEEQEQWIAETADALACAERLAARLAELRGTADLDAVLAIAARKSSPPAPPSRRAGARKRRAARLSSGLDEILGLGVAHRALN